ncbi:MAG: PAS domain S-box protein, partial [Nitrospirales bacterium]|nr:PAS domain S-box protein [Nitrospirales bacterium]
MKRFVQWLPLLILIPLWGGGLVLDRIAERVLLDSVHEHLVTALHAHQRHVLTMLAHQQRGLELFAGDAVQALAERRVPRLDAGYLTSLLPEVVGCVLLDAERRPVTRIGAAWPSLEEIATEFPPGTAKSRVTDSHQEPTGSSIYDVYVPLKVVSGGQPSVHVIGTLACRMKNILSQALAEHRAGLGLSGEVYLVDAETHLMLTESRFIPNAIGRVKVDTIGMREALKMRNGIAPYPDYRGIPVIGTFLYLRDYDWVLLAEMDKTEALAPLLHLRMVLGLSLGLISVATGVVGWRYGRQLSAAYAEAEKARNLAQEGEAQVKALLGNIADAVFEIDDSSTILLANKSAHRMFGWPSGELIGQKVTGLIPPEDVIKHETGLRRYLETGASHIIGKMVEVTGLRRNGS